MHLLLQFVYRSLVDFIKRFYAHPVLAAHATYHATASSGPDVVSDFQDGAVYADAMKDMCFCHDPRNLLLGLITDGIQPFEDAAAYSIHTY